MKKSLFLFSLVFLSTPFLAFAGIEVMDIYSGKGTPCEGISSYTYDANYLKYACIIQKSDGRNTLIVNGVEDAKYSGAESVYFGSSGSMIVGLTKNNLHAAAIGSYMSSWYTNAPSVTSDLSGNFALLIQDGSSYNWSYNGTDNKVKIFSYPYITTVFGSEKIVILDTLSQNTIDQGAEYDRAFIGGVRILSDYTHIVYEGEYTNKSKENVIIFLAQKGGTVELIEMNKNGKMRTIMRVKGTLNMYPSFSMDYTDTSKFAFTIKSGDQVRIVTNAGVSDMKYDSVSSLAFYPGLGLYKQVGRNGKYYFSLDSKGFGPYDTINYLTTSSNGKGWYVQVNRENKDFLVVNGKEISF